jgi:hypothetical protein
MGTLHPIMAKDENKAREYMFATYGNQWCTSYTEEQWTKWTREAASKGIPLEYRQPTVIYNPEVVPNDI